MESKEIINPLKHALDNIIAAYSSHNLSSVYELISKLSISKAKDEVWKSESNKELYGSRFPSSEVDVITSFKQKIEAYVKEFPNNKKLVSSFLEPRSTIGVGDSFKSIEALNDVFGDRTEAKIEHRPGEILFIDVWATWCGPCQGPMQHNVDMKENYADKWGDKVRIVCISLDEEKDDAIARINLRKWHNLEHYHVEGGWNFEHNLIQNYGIEAIPHCMLINQMGEIVWVGVPGEERIESKIEALLLGNSHHTGITKEAYKLLKNKFKNDFLKGRENKNEGKFSFDLKITKKTFFDSAGNKTSVIYENPSIEVKTTKKHEELVRKILNEITQNIKEDSMIINCEVLDKGAERLNVCKIINEALKTSDLPQILINFNIDTNLEWNGYEKVVKRDEENTLVAKSIIAPAPENNLKFKTFKNIINSKLRKVSPRERDLLEEFKLKSGLKVGDSFEGFMVEDAFSENKIMFDHKKGDVLLIDFWATWCGPCQEPMAHNQEMLERNKAEWKDQVKETISDKIK